MFSKARSTLLTFALTMLSHSTAFAQGGLKFPLQNWKPHTAPIVSVFDHAGPSAVTAFSAERGDQLSVDHCYTNSAELDFILYGNYSGLRSTGRRYLCYDGHRGFDLRANSGDAIFAPADGVVEYVFPDLNNDQKCPDPKKIVNPCPLLGNHLIINHDSVIAGIKTVYAHLKKGSLIDPITGLTWKKGDRILAGQQIAAVDNTGNTTADHLHFEVRLNNAPVDPYGWKGWLIEKDPYSYVSRDLWECEFSLAQQSGITVPTAATAAFQRAHSDIAQKFGLANDNGKEALGCPISQVQLGNRSFRGTVGLFQDFGNGTIDYYDSQGDSNPDGNPSGTAFVILRPMYTRWSLPICRGDESAGEKVSGCPNSKFAAGALGYPIGHVSDEQLSSQGTKFRFQNFEGGALEVHASGQRKGRVFEIHGGIFSKWSALGFANHPLGLPMSDERDALASAFGTSGRVNDFENGHIHFHSTGIRSGQSYETHGLIDQKYIALGGTASCLGFPVSDVFVVSGGDRANFEGGFILRVGTEVTANCGSTPPPTPVAVDDSYTVTQGSTLTVNPPGVLANDTVPTGVTPSIEFLPPFPPAGLTNSGGSGGFILDMRPNPTFVGTLTLHYVIHSVNGDSNTAAVTITVNPATIGTPDLTITKTASPNPVTSGGTLTYTITVRNMGTGSAPTVTVTDTLPTGAIFGSCSIACTASGNTVTAVLGNLGPSASTSFNIIVTAPILSSSDSITNLATVSADSDSNPDNNQVRLTTTVAVGRILRVPQDYATPQAAVDVCRSGDVIVLAPGLYSAPARPISPTISVALPLCDGSILMGSGPAQTVIDFAGGPIGVWLAQGTATVKLLQLRNASTQIFSYVGSSITVNNVIATAGAEPLELNQGISYTVRNIVVDGSRSVAIDVPFGGVADIQNNVITNNQNGIFVGFGGGTYAYNDVFGSLNLDWGVCTSVGCVPTPPPPNNLSADPFYCADFTLQTGSPAINVGNPAIFDPDGTRSDLGAYGGPEAILPPLIAAPCVIDFGAVPVGTTSNPISVLLRSTLLVNQAITGVSVNAPFVASDAPSFPMVLSPQSVTGFQVRFSPQQQGDVQAAILVFTSNPFPTVINVRGRGM